VSRFYVIWHFTLRGQRKVSAQHRGGAWSGYGVTGGDGPNRPVALATRYARFTSNIAYRERRPSSATVLVLLGTILIRSGNGSVGAAGRTVDPFQVGFRAGVRFFHDYL